MSAYGFSKEDAARIGRTVRNWERSVDVRASQRKIILGEGSAQYSGMFLCTLETETNSGATDYYLSVTSGDAAAYIADKQYIGTCIVNGKRFNVIKPEIRQLIEPAGNLYIFLRIPFAVSTAGAIKLSYSNSQTTDSAAVYYPIGVVEWEKSVVTDPEAGQTTVYTPKIYQIHQAGMISVGTVTQSDVVPFTVSSGSAEAGYTGTYEDSDGRTQRADIYPTEIAYPETLQNGVKVLAHLITTERLDS